MRSGPQRGVDSLASVDDQGDRDRQSLGQRSLLHGVPKLKADPSEPLRSGDGTLDLEAADQAEDAKTNAGRGRRAWVRVRIDSRTAEAAKAAYLDVEAVGDNYVRSPDQTDRVDSDPICRGYFGLTKI